MHRRSTCSTGAYSHIGCGSVGKPRLTPSLKLLQKSQCSAPRCGIRAVSFWLMAFTSRKVRNNRGRGTSSSAKEGSFWDSLAFSPTASPELKPEPLSPFSQRPRMQTSHRCMNGCRRSCRRKTGMTGLIWKYRYRHWKDSTIPISHQNFDPGRYRTMQKKPAPLTAQTVSKFYEKMDNY